MTPTHAQYIAPATRRQFESLIEVCRRNGHETAVRALEDALDCLTLAAENERISRDLTRAPVLIGFRETSDDLDAREHLLEVTNRAGRQ